MVYGTAESSAPSTQTASHFAARQKNLILKQLMKEVLGSCGPSIRPQWTRHCLHPSLHPAQVELEVLSQRTTPRVRPWDSRLGVFKVFECTFLKPTTFRHTGRHPYYSTANYHHKRYFQTYVVDLHLLHSYSAFWCETNTFRWKV